MDTPENVALIEQLTPTLELLWNMTFDGACSKERSIAGIWLSNPSNNHCEWNSYKLNFQYTNNIA